jgi:hypothetical protein
MKVQEAPMTLDEAIADLTNRIKNVSPEAVIRVQRRSAEDAAISTYAPGQDENAIMDATQEITLNLLVSEGLDVRVIVYDIATSFPPAE